MQTNKILRYTTLVGVFLIPFIPFIVSTSMFFPFITGKNFAFRILVELIVAVWVILAVRDEKYRPKWSPLLVSFLSFVGIIALADLLGLNPYKSFWSNFERMEGLITLLHLLAYFIVVGAVLDAEKLWERFFNTSILASVIMSFYGMLQLGGKLVINQGGVRLDGTFGNATYLAVYMLFHIFLTLFLLVRHKGPSFVKYLYGTAMVFQLFALYHTATRGAILALIAGSVLTFLLIVIFEKERKTLRKVSIGMLAGIVIFVFGFFLIRNTDFVKNSPVLSRFGSLSITEATGQARGYVWPMALKGFKERPILGWGQENFNIVFNKYYDPRMYSQEQWFDRTHNIILDWLIAGGVLGLLGYLSLFISSLYIIWKKKSAYSISDKSILTGLLGAYFFQNFFVFDNIGGYILFISLLGYLHFEHGRTRVEAAKHFQISEYAKMVITAVAIIGLILGLYFFNIRQISSSTRLIDTLQAQNDPKKSLELFKETLAYNTFGRTEAREQLVQVVSRVAAANVEQAVKDEYIAFVRAQMEQQIKENPGDARYEYFYGSLLTKLGFVVEGIAHLETAQKLSPQKQQILFELATAYFNSGDQKKAFETVKYAYELEPKFETARLIYAIIAIYAKNEALIRELLEPVYGTILVPDDRIIKAYYDTGEYKIVIEILKKKIETDPNNPQNRLFLAAAYFKTGERQKSIEEIQKVIASNPDFKVRGESYIKDIRSGKNPFEISLQS